MPRPGLPKLVATDLDGTLVRSDDTVSAYTHEVLDRVRAAGIPIVGATGRGPRLAELTRNDIRAADFLVMAGGGWVVDQTDPRGPVVLRDERLSGAVLATAAGRAGGRGRPAHRDGRGAGRTRTRRCGATSTRPGRYPERFESRSRAGLPAPAT